MTYAREQDCKCSGEQQFDSFFYAFEIKSMAGIGLRVGMTLRGVISGISKVR